MSAIGAAGMDLGFFYGATLAGVFGSLVLYGVSILQTFMYYLSYPDDSAPKKLLVAIVFLLVTVHSVVSCACVWNYLVQYFGDFANITVIHPVLLVPVVITNIVGPLVQSYFVWRIRCLSTGHFKQIFPVVMMPFVIFQPALAYYYVAEALMTPTITVLSGPVLMKVGYACLGIAAATDVIIATAMFVLLTKGRTQFNNHTDRILFHWTVISIHTVFWTASFSVITVILHALHPSDLLFTATYFPICELYCNTLLANFNARSWVGSNRVPPVSFSNRRRSLKPMAAAVPLPPFDISIETSKRVDLESYENHASFSA